MDHRIRFCQSFETLHKLGQLRWVFTFHCHSHHRADTELHDPHVVGILVCGDGTSLDKELINTDKTTDVTTRYIFNGLNITAHHENDKNKKKPLDALFTQVLFLARHIVGSHKAHFLSSGNSSSKNSPKGIETTLVRGRHHLRDVHHQRSLGITFLD
ncbi:hypothetical protein EGW08_021865, partial [Elysia chlorotica]